MKLYVAVPAMNEEDYIFKTIDSIQKQLYSNFKVFICINQPRSYWNNEKEYICINNEKTYLKLLKISDNRFVIIDAFSKKKALEDSRHNIGNIRRMIIDNILTEADNDDIIISLDADTIFGENYFMSIIDNFRKNQDVAAISVPYYHCLSGDSNIDIAMLKYEIYLRSYFLNLLRINSPYSFLALGSAIAVKVYAYKRVGGIPVKSAAEDFYFLQNLCKNYFVLIHNEEKVYPATRISDRVPFGTGVSINNLSQGMVCKIYSPFFFDMVETTYKLFYELYKRDVETPMDGFLRFIFKKDDIWNNLRNNYKDKKNFVRACHTKINALRVHQFLNYMNNTRKINIGNNFKDFVKLFKLDEAYKSSGVEYMKIDSLDRFRNELVLKEDNYRKNIRFTGIKHYLSVNNDFFREE